MERLVDIEKISFDDRTEVSLRPSKWDDYIGQDKIKRNLKVFIDASKKEQKHLIISCFLDLLDLVRLH
jgi:holliday junction DNA helicase RuvB